MKHLANCTNTEFLKQAMLVRAPLKAWLERTGIPAIRARRPEGWEELTKEQESKLTPEEREARRNALINQAERNMSEIVDTALRTDFDRSIELLCLVTFTDAEHFDDNPLSDYIAAVMEIMRDPGVRNFFTLYL